MEIVLGVVGFISIARIVFGSFPKVNKFIAIIKVAGVICCLLLLFEFSSYARDLWGEKQGNWINNILLVAIGLPFLIHHIKSSPVLYVTASDNKRPQYYLIWIGLSFLLGFTAWFSHPVQVLKRASNRVEDANKYYFKYLQDNGGYKAPTIDAKETEAEKIDNERMVKYYATALTVAQLEERAAIIRQKEKIGLFTGQAYLWTLSFIFLGCGFFNFYGNKSVYNQILPGTEKIYQNYFKILLSKLNLENMEKLVGNLGPDDQVLKEDVATIINFTRGVEQDLDLNSSVLQIMLVQYIYADPLIKKIKENDWFSTVNNREEAEYFPDQNAAKVIFNEMCSKLDKSVKRPLRKLKAKSKKHNGEV